MTGADRTTQPPPPSGDRSMTATLEGIRILDLSRMLAGPYGSMLLADMGAEVIKVESPDGDPIRQMGPPFVNGESAYFLSVNRNKRSVTLDLKSDRGRDLFFDLVRTSDVVYENFRPGVSDGLGIGPAACRAVRPDIITCSMSAFGADGPYRDLPAFDLILQAMGGAMSLTGEPGRPPMRMGLPMGDLAGGMFAATAICAALWRRERIGEGQHIDLALLDAQVSLLTYIGQYTLTDGRIPPPSGTGHQSVVPYQAFATADSHLVVAVFTDRFWSGFCHAVGMPELIERYPTSVDRHTARDELVPLLEQRFLEHATDDWITLLRAADVPCSPVQTVDKVLADEQVRHRGMVVHTDRPHPVAGTHQLIGNPIRTGGPQRWDPAPLLGEHNAEVYSSLLGLDQATIEQLRTDGVI